MTETVQIPCCSICEMGFDAEAGTTGVGVVVCERWPEDMKSRSSLIGIVRGNSGHFRRSDSARFLHLPHAMKLS